MTVLKTPQKKSDQFAEVSSKGSKHTKTAKSKNIFSKIAGAVFGVFAALFFFLKRRFRSEGAKVFLAIVLTLAVILASYFIILRVIPNRAENESTTQKEVVEAYVKKLAVCDFNALIDYDYIETGKLVEAVLENDYNEYIETELANQKDVFGNNPQIKIKDIKFSDISISNRGNIGNLLKKEFSITVPEKVLEEGKTAVVQVTKSGNGKSADVQPPYTLFLLKVDSGNGQEWKVINNYFVEKYSKNNNTYVPEANDFAADEDFFK